MSRKSRWIFIAIAAPGVIFALLWQNMTFKNFVHALSYNRTLDAYEPIDTTVTEVASRVGKDGREASVLSAFFGLDNGLPPLAGRIICKGAARQDGMPVVFSHEIDRSTLQPGDFKIVTESGSTRDVLCLTMAPSDDEGEMRTALLVGELGDLDDQPAMLEITGNVLTMDGSANFVGSKVHIVPLEDGPSLVWSEIVPEAQWAIGSNGTALKFGGGTGCPDGTKQVVRVVWNGGVTKPNGHPIDDKERIEYKITLRNADGTQHVTVSDALGDLWDGDNNHKLCLNRTEPAISVSFGAGFVTDPRGDLNGDTEIRITSQLR